MCGIAAIVLSRPSAKSELGGAIAAMTRALKHRGPDHAAVWTGTGVALGHTRLRVVDLDPRSDQPFFYRDLGEATPRLVYNGELYNTSELRRDLGDFRTTSDTEVVYQAYRRFGLDCFARFKGMYALAILDPQRQSLILARDPVGIKPLYWASTPRGVLVASEVTALVSSGWLEPRLDPRAVHQVSRFNHLLGSNAALEGVQCIAPGSVCEIRLDDAQFRQHSQRRLALRREDASSFRDRSERLDAAFVEAVRSHMVADLPVACYLSGGIDSTGLAAEASLATARELHTYSLLFPGQPFNEQSAISRVLRHLEVKHESFAITETNWEEYRRYIAHAEMPQLWTTDLALCRLAKNVGEAGVRVVLSGEGPDELFAGYDSFRFLKLRRWLDKIGASHVLRRLPRSSHSISVGTWFDVELSMLRFYAEQHAEAQRTHVAQRYGFYPENIATWNLLEVEAGQAFAAGMRDRRQRYEQEDAAQLKSFVAGLPQGLSPLQQNLMFELGVRLPNWVLPMADRMSSAHGLELRVPYLADDFVDAALTLPDSDRVRGLDEKHILKHMHRRRVPRFVRRRHKQPLYTPITEWVRGFFGEPGFQEQWSQQRFAEVGLFDHRAAWSLAERVQDSRFTSLLERLATEWMFMLICSTHVLDAHMRETAARASAGAPPALPEAQGV